MDLTPRLARLAHRAAFPASALPAAAYLTDCHVHTTFTDGKSTVRENLDAAAGRGLRAIAFTEHVRRGCDWFGRFRREVAREARRRPDLTTWVGCEAKALTPTGGLDADAELIAACDLVLGAFHGYPDGHGGWLAPKDLSAFEAAHLEMRATMGLAAHPEVDVIAHVGGLTRRRFGWFPAVYMRAVVREAARAGKAVELNGEYMAPVDLATLLAYCQAEGAWVTLGSNAHHASEVGRIGPLVEAEAIAHAG